MLEIISYTLAGIILYVVSDSILEQLEIRRGERFVYRDIIFFVIILTLALITFASIEYLFKE